MDAVAASNEINDHVTQSFLALNNIKNGLGATILALRNTISPIIDASTDIGQQANIVYDELTYLETDLIAAIDNFVTQIQDSASNQIAQINTVVVTTQTQLPSFVAPLNAEIEAALSPGTVDATNCAESARDTALNNAQSSQLAITGCISNAKEMLNSVLDSSLNSVALQVNGVVGLSDTITACVQTYQSNNDGAAGKDCLVAADVNTFRLIATSSLDQSTTSFVSNANTLRSGTQTCVNRALANGQWFGEINLSNFQQCLV